MVPGSEITPDWRAILVGAVIAGLLCSVPVLGGWIQMPGDVEQKDPQKETPGVNAALIPFLIGMPGPFVAGYLARPNNVGGAVEGMNSVLIGGSLPIVAALAREFLMLGSMSIAWKIEFLWRGVGFYAVVALLFVPIACILGAALGWVGQFTRDVVRDGVRISWS